MHPTAVCTPVGTFQSPVSNPWSSSGVGVGYSYTSALLDKHTGVFPMSKQAAGGRLDCVARKDTLPGMTVGGTVSFVLAPQAPCPSTTSSPRHPPCCQATPVSSEHNPKLWSLAPHSTVLLPGHCLKAAGVWDPVSRPNQTPPFPRSPPWRPSPEPLLSPLPCFSGSDWHHPPLSEGTQ